MTCLGLPTWIQASCSCPGNIAVEEGPASSAEAGVLKPTGRSPSAISRALLTDLQVTVEGDILAEEAPRVVLQREEPALSLSRQVVAEMMILAGEALGMLGESTHESPPGLASGSRPP